MAWKNKAKMHEYNKAYYWKNKDNLSIRKSEFRNGHGRFETLAQARRYRMKKLYGINESDFQALALAQCGQCAICGTACDIQSPEAESRKTPTAFRIDHDHATGAGAWSLMLVL